MLHSTAIYIIIMHLFHTNVTQQKKDGPKAALSLIYQLLIPSRVSQSQYDFLPLVPNLEHVHPLASPPLNPALIRFRPGHKS